MCLGIQSVFEGGHHLGQGYLSVWKRSYSFRVFYRLKKEMFVNKLSFGEKNFIIIYGELCWNMVDSQILENENIKKRFF